MTVIVRSFAKINLGLCIGGLRPDGFHELHTVYQTIGLHDIIRVTMGRGSGIQIRCNDPGVPQNDSNTCYRMAERALEALKVEARVLIEIEKRLPVQGGLGGASGNAVAVLFALERGLKKQIPGSEKLRIATEVGSDLPLFLVGGTVLGVGRGEEAYPLPDLPPIPCVVALAPIGVSTPKAFADWDLMVSGQRHAAVTGSASCAAKLTVRSHSDRMLKFSRRVSAWLSGLPEGDSKLGRPKSGVPARGRGRAESPLLDLVRTGIENDFEQVVFPQYPELREVKCLLERGGAVYTSMSGSGAAVYGLFASRAAAQKGAAKVEKSGVPVQITTTLTRQQYWKRIYD